MTRRRRWDQPDSGKFSRQSEHHMMKSHIRRMAMLLIPAVALITATSPVRAQETPAPEPQLSSAPKWQFSFTTYLWVAGMDGDVTARGREADVDVSVADGFDNLVDNFKLAITGHLEARRDRLALFGDVAYISLEQDVERRILGEGTIDTAQGFFELGIGYTVIDEPLPNHPSRRFRLEPIAGARMYYLDMELSFDSIDRTFGDDKLWVDGFVGLRSSVDIADRLSLFGRFDIGAGGSDLAWNAVLGADLKLGKHKRVSLLGGYRWLDVDYDDGSGDNKFVFDVLMHGPFVGLGFTF